MKIAGLLVKVRGDGHAFASAAAKALGPSAVAIEPICTCPLNGVTGHGALRRGPPRPGCG